MKSRRLKIGIIGCGAIGSALAEYCVRELRDVVRLVALFDSVKDKARALEDKLQAGAIVARSLGELIDLSELVIEAASADVVPQALKKALEKKRDIMIMSVGGILKREDLLKKAKKSDCRVYIPSGAILGLDGIKAASLRRIDSIILTTKKPKEALRDAPYIEKNRIDLDSLKSETLIFEGSAMEAIEGFPKNINVSVTLSLAGIGAKETKVRIVCDPQTKMNIHEIEVNGESGRLFMRAENLPSPHNPKTSLLAILSSMATLKGIIDRVRIGT